MYMSYIYHISYEYNKYQQITISPPQQCPGSADSANPWRRQEKETQIPAMISTGQEAPIAQGCADNIGDLSTGWQKAYYFTTCRSMSLLENTVRGQHCHVTARKKKHKKMTKIYLPPIRGALTQAFLGWINPGCCGEPPAGGCLNPQAAGSITSLQDIGEVKNQIYLS